MLSTALILLAQVDCNTALFGNCNEVQVQIPNPASCDVALFGDCLNIPTGTASLIINDIDLKVQFVNPSGNTFGTTTTEYRFFVKTIGTAKSVSTKAGDIPVYRFSR
ncbi:MAG: hypothetical protein WCK98_07570 [bacterium]